MKRNTGVNTQSTLQRYQTQVRKFRNAIIAAENESAPSFIELYRTYIDVQDDPEVSKCRSIVLDYIQDCDIKVDEWKSKSSKDKTDKLLSSSFMTDLIRYVVDSMYWGHSLVHIGDIVDGIPSSVSLIPRWLVNPKLQRVYTNTTYSSDYITFDDVKLTKYHMYICPNKDNLLGQFSQIAIPQIQLKDSTTAYYSYIQRYATPSVVIQTDTTDESELDRMDEYASQFGSNSYAIIGANDKITMLDTRNQTGEAYMSIITMLREQITSCMLGSSSLGNEKSFVGSAKVSYDIAETRIAAIIEFAESVINNQLFPLLISLGCDYLQGVSIEFDDNEEAEVSNADMINLAKIMVDSGVSIKWDSIACKFGIELNDTTQPEVYRD